MNHRARVVRRLVVAAGLTLAAARCSREARPGASGEGFEADPQPIVSIRGTTPAGEVLFGVARGAARLSNGAIAVADGSPTAPAVVFFDSQGRKVQSVGRTGTGPGEYRTIAWLKRCGPDTLYVYDYWLRRVAVLDAEGNSVREFPLPTFATFAGCSPSGAIAILGVSETAPPAAGGSRTAHGPLVLVDARGEEVRTLGQAPTFDLVQTDFGGWMPRLAGRFPSVAVSRERVYVGPSDSSSVIVFALDGRRLPSLPVRGPRRAPARRHLEAAADYMVTFAPPGALRDRMRERSLGIAPAEQLPPFSTLVVDPDGLLWANLSVPGDTATVLRALGPAGEVLGEVRLPVALTVFEIGEDYVLGAYEDAAGEPVVALYPLHRGR